MIPSRAFPSEVPGAAPSTHNYADQIKQFSLLAILATTEEGNIVFLK
jgi:hypothetical protein